jgi:phosphoribosylformylglycinamidine cyclo-ligase
MFNVFNMGVGYVLIVRPAFADSIAAHLKEEGENPIVLGTITKGSGKVQLVEGDSAPCN